MRLEKVIEETCQASRKEIKRLLLGKKVKIDGLIESRGSRNVDSTIHQIAIDGRPVTTQHRYYLLNKPQKVVTANHDQTHQTVFDLLAPQDRGNELYAVGRLDRDTTGLLLLTDNGPLGYDLLQPGRKVTKTYEAVVNEPVTKLDIEAFAKGIVFHGGVCCQPAELTLLEQQGSYSRVRLMIQEGKFHQVKKMFLACGKKVVSLKRSAMGPLILPADLAIGDYRPLTAAELYTLKPYFR